MAQHHHHQSEPEPAPHRMDRGSFVSSERYESLTCGAAPAFIERLRTAADAGQKELKVLAQEVQSEAIARLGGSGGSEGSWGRGGGGVGGVEVAFGRAMGRSFYATEDGSTTTADIVLFFTLDPLDIDTKQSTCVRRECHLSASAVMQALYKIQTGSGGGAAAAAGGGGGNVVVASDDSTTTVAAVIAETLS